MKVYHHNDMDGRCGAAIVKMATKTKITIRDYEEGQDNEHPVPGPLEGQRPEFFEMDYNREPDFSTVQPGEIIVIVDFSFKPEVMAELITILGGHESIIWLDHYATAADYDYGVALDGLRNFEDKEQCGAELAWEFLFPDDELPEAVRRIGDYDTWRHAEDSSLAFYEGMKMQDCSPEAEIWGDLVGESGPDIVSVITHAGGIAIEYRKAFCEDFCKSYGFEVELDGHKGYAANLYMYSSKAFGARMAQYEFCAGFAHDGEKLIVSLYSQNGLDVSALCKARGGGGHAGAAGFTCEVLPFEKAGE